MRVWLCGRSTKPGAYAYHDETAERRWPGKGWLGLERSFRSLSVIRLHSIHCGDLRLWIANGRDGIRAGRCHRPSRSRFWIRWHGCNSEHDSQYPAARRRRHPERAFANSDRHDSGRQCPIRRFHSKHGRVSDRSLAHDLARHPRLEQQSSRFQQPGECDPCPAAVGSDPDPGLAHRGRYRAIQSIRRRGACSPGRNMGGGGADRCRLFRSQPQPDRPQLWQLYRGRNRRADPRRSEYHRRAGSRPQRFRRLRFGGTERGQFCPVLPVLMDLS